MNFFPSIESTLHPRPREKPAKRTKIEWAPAPSNPAQLTDSQTGPEWDSKQVQVLRIPVSGSRCEPLILGTTRIDRGGQDLDRETIDTETWFRHVPNILDCKEDDLSFDWDKRSLVAAYVNDRRSTDVKTWWCIYRCNEPSTGPPRKGTLVREMNPFFSGIKGAKAFGDVWLFKLKDTANKIVLDRLGRIRYAEKWEVPNERDLRRLVDALAHCRRANHDYEDEPKRSEPKGGRKLLRDSVV